MEGLWEMTAVCSCAWSHAFLGVLLMHREQRYLHGLERCVCERESKRVAAKPRTADIGITEQVMALSAKEC